MIYTARYSNRSIDSRVMIPVAITLGEPKFPLPFTPIKLPALAPSGSTFAARDDDELFTRRYLAQLDRIRPAAIHTMLAAIYRNQDGDVDGDLEGKDLVLLCFEDLRKPEQWCHRRLFADWWLERTGEIVDELQEAEPLREPGKKRKVERVSDEQKAIDLFGGLDGAPAASVDSPCEPTAG
jgi:hypothetical protein